MSHDHSHDGDSTSDYYVEQLFTILVCGALGVVAIRMYQTDMLGLVLAAPFHLPVLIGGISVLVLVVLRSISVWRESGRASAPSHAGLDRHEHGEECNHEHGHDHGHAGHTHDHSHQTHDHGHAGHGHSHDLSWTFARLLVLSFPVSLYLMGVPNKGFSQDHLKKLLGNEESIGQVEFGAGAGGDGIAMRFNDLNDAAYDPAKRQSLDGQTVVLEGMLQRLGEKEFTLFRLKMTCCAADTLALKVRIVTKQSLSGFNDFEWVRVKGQLQFIPAAGTGRFVPVIKVADLPDIKPIATPKSDYE